MAMPVESEKELEQLIAMYRTGIPDLDIRIQHIVAEDDLVVTRVESRHNVDDLGLLQQVGVIPGRAGGRSGGEQPAGRSASRVANLTDRL